MRRLAAVFKRDKKQLQHPALAIPAPPVPSPSSTLSTPQLSIASDKATSSASSSSHDPSFSLPTPTDDLPASLSPKRSWRNWIGARRTNSFKRRPQAPPVPDWTPKQDSDEEEDDDREDDYGHDPAPLPSPASAHHILETRLKNSLVPPLPVSPFVQHDLGPFFPRSSNRPALLPPQSSLRVAMFRDHLLTRLQHPGSLSPVELSSIRPLGAKQPPSILSPPAASFPDSTYPATSTKILPASPGTRRWIARPCFEDRHQVFLATDSQIDCRPVSATAAVAALEYSEYLDVIVDPDFDLFPAQNTPPEAWLPPPPTLLPTLSHAPALESQPLSAAQKRNSYTAVPSPLRNQHNSPPTLEEPEPLVAPKSTVKRIVRFAEDNSDGDDGVPLHVVRMKKKREEKANFLRQERLKRAKEEEEERRQHEHEARLREQEALEKEHRRQALEKERKEKEKALYAETIAATRLRRETQRTGGVVSSNTASQSSNLLAPSTSFTSLKDSERNNSARFSRTPHDAPSSISIPRREGSDQSLYPNSPASYAHQQYPSDSSPGSSRPPSIVHSPVSLNSPGPGHHSRPASTYSSSSEDARHQSGSVRNSVAAAGNGSLAAFGRPPIIASYPTWSGSNPNISYIPPVPPFPDYVHDMPLLPPTAPFMKHAYKPRSPSSRNVSPGPSTSSSSRRGSFNSSTERVNQLPSPPQMTSARTPSSSPHPNPRRQSSTSSSRPTHQRHGSGESRTQQSAVPSSPRPAPATSRSYPSLSRGRPQQPQYASAPSSWMTSPVQPVFVPVPVGVPVGMYSMGGGMPTSVSNPQMQMQMQGMGMGMGMPMGMPMNMPMMNMPMNYVGPGPVSPGSGSKNGGSITSRTRGWKQPDIS